MFKRGRNGQEGSILLEAVVGGAILLTALVALVPLFVFASDTSLGNKLHTTATNVAIQEIEKIKTLTYDDVGVVGGNPAGSLEPDIQKTVGATVFSIETRVRWVDDESDGVTPVDSDPRDYKQATIKVSWNAGTAQRSVRMVTAIARESEDQIAQGGNIAVIVRDIDGSVIEGAKVQVTAGPSSPISDWTDEEGKVFFAMLSPSVTEGDYSLTVTKSGYLVRPDLVVQTTTVGVNETRSLEFIMARPGTLTVRLVDEFGATIQKPSRLTLTHPDTGEVTLNESQGYFDVSGLFPGAWGIVPFAPSFEYTGGPITVDLAAGGSEAINIGMNAVPQGGLQLRVFDGASAAGIPDADVTITNIGTLEAVTAMTNAVGRLEIALDVGTYDIKVDKAGYTSKTMQADIIASTNTPLDVYLDAAQTQGAILVQTLNSGSGSPRSNVRIRVVGPGYNQTGQTDAQGEILFGYLNPGSYTVYRWSSGWRNPRTVAVSAGLQSQVVYSY